jgi:predicted HicB family RNase H-like nuclease
MSWTSAEGHPSSPLSGRLLRVFSETHAAKAQGADLAGNNVNQWAVEVLDRTASRVSGVGQT